ncbi:TPA: endoribonuclease MazF [Escherichia coli]|uniref:Endoribonuclease MazF n=1 Tax=Salmonella enteritidis TaxID=149539 RepID=A0A625PPR4_SALEN|nr:endoribonuclease MazF [Escherichia coli]EBR8672418.1 endoribonuclease MazF [Salmonella enterica subsp. enterica serovar Corvallis]ECF4462308.1 endoribonuclease MazF [Salmonella enterica subsp. enterica serovar Anatum]ECZ9813142.1 endoribonuclease MazF [Salmonella enterica subsp. enterica serovar Enteritidis]EJG9149283.1 endoribonuclease MazF [Salmonella enterica]HBN4411202.1 endoribonuclease MazF [Escherichia coli O25b:H4-ST131]HBU7280767.1 endoribonuclease MazF [Klebsiella pneumoniae]HEO
MTKYIPDAGDVVWLNFDPQAGHEQAGHRPALVISPAIYNGRIGLMVCCPMTTKIKGYPFEVLVGEGSAVLADQVKSLDWKIRGAVKKGSVPDSVLSEVRAKAKALIGG